MLAWQTFAMPGKKGGENVWNDGKIVRAGEWCQIQKWSLFVEKTKKPRLWLVFSFSLPVASDLCLPLCQPPASVGTSAGFCPGTWEGWRERCGMFLGFPWGLALQVTMETGDTAIVHAALRGSVFQWRLEKATQKGCQWSSASEDVFPEFSFIGTGGAKSLKAAGGYEKRQQNKISSSQ